MATSRKTKHGTARLSEVARHLVKPAGIVRTGWPAIEATCRRLGTGFDQWQADLGRLMFAKTADGIYAATVGGVGMSLPRQVGKTHLVGFSMFALCVNTPGLTVIWTAHHSRTADETLLAMQGMASRPKVAPHVKRILTGNSGAVIEFHNGSRILFGARDRGFGRGFAGVDVLVFDEAQILTDRALDAMLATMNTAPNGLALFMGTPPTPTDPSETFLRMRRDALAGESDDMAWVECGADPDASPDDRSQWGKANPSYPHRTPLTSMLRLRRKLSPESWMREGLGIWDEDAMNAFSASWAPCKVPGPPPVAPQVLAVASGIDQTHSVILAAAAQHDLVHVKPLQYGPGTAWVVDETIRLAKALNLPVVIDGRGPASSLIPDLEDAVDLRVKTTDDVVNASAEFWSTVTEGRARHAGYPELDEAVRVAVKRPVGNRWAWGARKSEGDISPLEAATLAAWELAHPDGGPNIFTSSTTESVTVVCGPLAEQWANAQAAPADLMVPHADFIADAYPDAAWIIWDSPGAAQAWRRDRFRMANPDVRMVIVTDEFETYKPSKYHPEELVTIGGN